MIADAVDLNCRKLTLGWVADLAAVGVLLILLTEVERTLWTVWGVLLLLVAVIAREIAAGMPIRKVGDQP